jgi:chemotaxis response regulator CheB
MRTRILIVDASLTIRALLTMLFDADNRFAVIAAAADAGEAAASIHDRPPDIAILEHPDEDDTALLTALAAEQVPILLLAAGAQRALPLSREWRALGVVGRFDKARLRGDARRFADMVAHAAQRDREAKLRYRAGA